MEKINKNQDSNEIYNQKYGKLKIIKIHTMEKIK